MVQVWTRRGQLPPGAVPTRPPVRVLMALSPPDGTTRYVDQIAAGAPAEVEITYRTWRSVFTGRYDVLHLHWPEKLVAADRAARPLVSRLLFVALLIRLKLQRVAVVRTLHNTSPHEGISSRWQQRLLDWCDRQTTLYITINPVTEPAVGAESVTVLHGHYRTRFAHLEHPAAQPGRLLFFGLLRNYKGVDQLLAAFAGADDADWRLRLVGAPFDQSIADDVERAAAADHRISACLGSVPDRDLVAEICRSELIVLPYRAMHNSGAVLLALSLDRPVLVPRTPVNQALAGEVGPGWIHMYDGELTVTDIRNALTDNASGSQRSAPDLRGRDWDTVGEGHYQAYLRAMAIARPARPARSWRDRRIRSGRHRSVGVSHDTDRLPDHGNGHHHGSGHDKTESSGGKS